MIVSEFKVKFISRFITVSYNPNIKFIINCTNQTTALV